MLRPHLLAILFFCLLVVGILRSRAWLVFLAAAGYALSYHAFYIVGLVAAVAWMYRRRLGSGNARGWFWCLAGLVVGVVVNPYFPSNLLMSWLHVQLALGIGIAPGSGDSVELIQPGWENFLLIYGFVFAGLLTTAIAIKLRAARDTKSAELEFLFVLTLLLAVLGAKSLRAMEYAVPALVMLIGHGAQATRWRWWIPINLMVLLACHGYAARIYYRENWRQPEEGGFAMYSAAISGIPADAAGKKVFNCEWESGAYLLLERPDLHFVDLLEPAFLWRVSPQKYLARRTLVLGGYSNPQQVLRAVFRADYVLCHSPALIRQMEADPQHFILVRGAANNPVRLFTVRAD
jgi:hypothetical protein